MNSSNSSLDDARERFAQSQRANRLGVPPGYRPTKAALLRVAELQGCPNRAAARALEAKWRREDKRTPFETFEPDV